MNKYYLFLLFLIPSISNAYEGYQNEEGYSQAQQKISEAFYIESGVDKMVDKNIKELREKLPPYCKKTLDVITPIVDIIVKQRIELRHEF